MYARTDRAYIRRYSGETNTRLMIALDTSASMGFASAGAISKLRYQSLSLHHWPTWPCSSTIRWDSSPSTRRSAAIGRRRAAAAACTGILHALDAIAAGSETDLSESLRQLREHRQRRGLVTVISDLYCDPEASDACRRAAGLAWSRHHDPAGTGSRRA